MTLYRSPHKASRMKGVGGMTQANTSEPIVMALCEQRHVTLRPDTPYVFRAVPGCEECERIARELDEEAWGC